MNLYIIAFDYLSPKFDPNRQILNEIIENINNKINLTIITNSNENKYSQKNNFSILEVKTRNSNGRNVLDLKSMDSKLFIKNIIKDSKNIFMGVSYPFYTTINALKQLKKMYKNSKTILYEIDPFAYNDSSRKSFLVKKIRIIYQMYQFSLIDNIWLTRELYIYYQKRIFKIFNKKFKKFELPILYFDNNFSPYNMESTDINVTFAGTFYDNIREPDFLLMIFSEVLKIRKDIKLKLYGDIVGKKSSETIKKYVDNKNIFHLGKLSKDEINLELEKSRIVINVGNKSENQLPSKLLEYLSHNYSVIHLSSIDNDTSLFYLSMYKNKLIIKEDFSNENIKKAIDDIIKFINTNKIPGSNSMFKGYYKHEIINNMYNEILKLGGKE